MEAILFAIIKKVSVNGRCYLFLDAGGSTEIEPLKSCYAIACRGIYKKWIVILATTSGGMWEYPKEVKELYSHLEEDRRLSLF